MSIRQYASNIHKRSELFAEVVSACRSLFRHSSSAKDVRDYMSDRLSSDSLDKYSIGYFPPDSDLDELTSLIGRIALKELEILYDNTINNRSHIDTVTRTTFNRNNIIFPFKDEYGNIIALAGRTLLDEVAQKQLKTPKYKNTVFKKSMHLYGLYHTKDAIEQKGCAIVVEGQIDCISCHANGFTNTVALTCSELTLYQLYLLKKMTNTIYLLLDNDTAGRRATEKTISKFSNFINIKPLKLPDSYKDVDEYLCKNNKYDLFNQCLGGTTVNG